MFSENKLHLHDIIMRTSSLLNFVLFPVRKVQRLVDSVQPQSRYRYRYTSLIYVLL